MSLTSNVVDQIHLISSSRDDLYKFMNAQAAGRFVTYGERLSWGDNIGNALKLVNRDKVDPTPEQINALATDMGYTGPLDGSVTQQKWMIDTLIEMAWPTPPPVEPPP